MTQLFGIPLTLLTPILEVVTAIIIVGVALLAIVNVIFFKIGVRNIPRRRQQIGMLRALGCKRLLIQGAFLSESFFVGCTGSLLGIILGLIQS